MNKQNIIFTGDINGKWVSVNIIDLDEFIHANADSEIFCEDEDGNQLCVRKINVHFKSVYKDGRV